LLASLLHASLFRLGSGSVSFFWTGKIPISRVGLNPPTQLDHGLGQPLAQDQFKITGSSNEFVGMSGALGEHQAVLCRRTGKIYWRSDDVEDEENYVAIPDKQELGLSKSLALEFAREFLLNDFDEELLRPLLRHAADDVAHNGGCQYAPRNAAIPPAHAVAKQKVSILTPAREG